MATREVEGMEGWKETYDSFGQSGIRTKASKQYRDNFALERRSPPRPGRTRYSLRACGHAVPVGEFCKECWGPLDNMLRGTKIQPTDFTTFKQPVLQCLKYWFLDLWRRFHG